MIVRRWLGVGLMLWCVIGLSLQPMPQAMASSKLDPQLAQLPADQSVAVLIGLRPAAVSISHAQPRRVQRSQQINQLKAWATQQQLPVLQLLTRLAHDHQISAIRPLWISNQIAVVAQRAVLDYVLQLPEVSSITLDLHYDLPALHQAPTRLAAVMPSTELSLIKAPALWQRGYRGQGVVVAVLDTGVDLASPELANRWRGGQNSWFDPYHQHSTPVDLTGHGSAVTGVILAGAASGTQLGVAPEAQWIAAKLFNDAGKASTSAIHAAFQWVLDPDHNPETDDAPAIVHNSWGLVGLSCVTTFHNDLVQLNNAGMVVVFSAGDGGSAFASGYSPADDPLVIAVGAVDQQLQLWDQSSRGPATCPPAAPRVFPELVAPGVNVLSTDRNGLYTASSGTSLAAPYVSGGVALLLSAEPARTAADVRQVLQQSALDLGEPGADDLFGAGLLDLSQAYQLLRDQHVYLPWLGHS